ncbi:hypothetical protein D3C74_302990 [compost metagenome]
MSDARYRLEAHHRRATHRVLPVPHERLHARPRAWQRTAPRRMLRAALDNLGDHPPDDKL